MKTVGYRLIEGSSNDLDNIAYVVLQNRGIKDYKQYIELRNDWLNANRELIPSYELLENINEAVDCFNKHFENRDPISILVDCDPDGYSSAAVIYRYIKMMDNEYPVHYLIHEINKNHGISKIDFILPSDTKLIIIPDAGTNDCIQCNNLIENGVSVIVLDHHIQSKAENSIKSNAIIVNNQISYGYPNKDFCGAGIVFEFIRALDDYYWNDFADEFSDLVAFANISDSMDLRNYATRYYVEYGLSHIRSPILQTMIDAQSYSMHGEVNVHNVSWYMTPIFNAMIRIGDYESRDLLFRAFIEDYDEFEYKKKGGEIVQESIYERAVRLCKNCKSRQDKMRDKLFEALIDKVDAKNKIIMLKVDEQCDPGIIGISAMKLADACQRPTILLRETEIDGHTCLSGSCRNFENSPVDNLKNLIDQTGLFELCAGHANAAGVQLSPNKFESALIELNDTLKEVVYDPTYQCDFVLDISDLNVPVVQAVDEIKWLWCTGIKEPLFAIENITVIASDVRLQGKNKDSISFDINGVAFVQFKLKEGDLIYDFINDLDRKDDDQLSFNAVCTLCISNYKNILKPQAIIHYAEAHINQ